MVKNKNTKNQSQTQKVEAFVARVGLTAMSVAAVTSLVHMYEARDHKAMPALQPASAQVTQPVDPYAAADNAINAFRRERDEIRHMSVSYGSSMRSHPTAGTV